MLFRVYHEKKKIFRYNGKLLSSMSLNHTELYEVDWRPSVQKYQDFNPSPKLHAEEKKDEKPRKLFKPPKGTGNLAFPFIEIYYKM